MRTGEKVMLGLTAAATVLYVSSKAIRAYRKFLEEQKEADKLSSDYLARNAEPAPPIYK